MSKSISYQLQQAKDFSPYFFFLLRQQSCDSRTEEYYFDAFSFNSIYTQPQLDHSGS